MTSFFTELQRRNVHRAALFYAGAAWLLVQIATQVFPFFDIPNSTVRIVVIAVVIGFPFAMLFSWFYEWTPQGIKLESEIDRSESVTRQTGKTMDRWIIAVLALAVVLLLTDRLTPSKPAAAPADKSIAVLPFENLSAEPANAFFANGIQDEILTGLARIGDLKVISRTSTQRYSSRPGNIAEIAKELAVAHILEGSVQKSANRIRVNVQLIDAATDNHLWAETYDRELDDVFAVQSEVAQKIAASLKAKLTPAERVALTTSPTGNPAAYALYMKARASSGQMSRQEIDQKIAVYRQAVALDPDFALAWAELSRYASLAVWGGYGDGQLALEGQMALDRATALAPELPQVAKARAVFLYYGSRDYAGALAVLEPVKKALPGDFDVWLLSGLLERRLGLWQQAVADFERARLLAPNDDFVIFTVAATQALIGHYEATLALLAETRLGLDADVPSALWIRPQCLWVLGRLDDAERTLAQMPAGLPAVQSLRGLQALYRRDYPEAIEQFRKAVASKADLDWDLSFSSYIPARIDWQLRLAMSEQLAGATEQARAGYEQLKALATTALAAEHKSANPEAAWRFVLAMALAGLGESDTAVEQAQQAIATLADANDALEGPGWQYYLAVTYAMTGNAAKAVPILDHLLHRPSSLLTVELLKLDPIWDPLRQDARFRSLLAEGSATRPAVAAP
ncbi:hypothetical protein [Nevskia ramosa]|uniref:hypothetical protein n=1 Tax=Nevskia ramosa TaxID=64002 RepID=UPI0003B6BECD|nr:hypothetical protein [Nevskia ramosa]